MARSIYPQVLAQVDATTSELRRRPFDHDAAAVEDHDVVGHVEHELGVLLDQHDRQPLGLQPPDGRHDLGDDLRRQPFRRLVHQEHARVRHQRAPDRQHLLLAARERAGDLPAALLKPREQRGDRLERPEHGHSALRLAPGHGEVFADGEATKHAAALRDQGHPERRDGLGRPAGDGAAVDADRAAAGREQADRDVHRGRLAGAVASEQAQQPPLAQTQRHAVQHVAVAVEGVDLVERERVVRHGAPTIARVRMRSASRSPFATCRGALLHSRQRAPPFEEVTMSVLGGLKVVVALLSAIAILVLHGDALAQSAPPTLVMISIDGLRPDYVTAADTHGLKIPSLRRFLKEGAFADGVTGVIPTVTYPSHTTLITAVSPAKHAILGNTVFDPPGKNQRGWYGYAEDIKVPTLWDAARQAGMTTASIQWPASVGARVNWNIPEIWRANTDEDAKLVRALATDGLLPELEKA